MNRTSQQVTKSSVDRRVTAKTVATTRVRGVAGNHVLMRKERPNAEVDQLEEPIQKKQAGCACGGNGGDGACRSCSGDTPRVKLRRKESNARRLKGVPPIVHQVLRTPGRPLDSASRAFMEPRFGHDFSRVRVHTDRRANESAREVNALAYTVGQHVVLATGQGAPGTDSGRRILAHELAHTIQQPISSSIPSSIGIAGAHDAFELAANRAADAALNGEPLPPLLATPATGVYRFASCGNPTACPPRDTGETVHAERDHMIFGEISDGVSGVIVANFDIGSTRVKSDFRRNPRWTEFKRDVGAATDVDWEILGFTDCEGSESRNETLRRARADAVFHDLPAAARSRVTARRAAPLSDCIAENTDAEGRKFNRSALFSQVATRVDFQGETLQGTSCAHASRATTFDEYVNLVLCAERALPTFTPRQMLSMLRQLYYSDQSWSRCRGAGCQFWPDVIPCGISVANPETALGTPLFNALRDSQVVDGVDLGHVFTGLESMFCPTQSVDLNVTGPNFTVNIANYEFATWAGDLGSAVAQKIHDEQDLGMSVQPWSSYFLTSGSLASQEDLLGDIDAYVMRAGLSGSSCQDSPRQTLTTLGGPVSEVLHNYYGVPSSSEASLSNRFACFVRALGGTVAGNRISGDLITFTERIEIPIGEFGENFYRLKWHTGYFATGGIGAWFVNYRHQLAQRFVQWLDSNL